MTTKDATNTPENGGASNVLSGTLGAGEQDGSGSDESTNRSLTRTLDESKEGLMPHTTDTPANSHRERCIEFLSLARADLEQARLTRIRYAHMARAYGLSNQAIGDALGVTETAVRTLMKRNPEGVRRG